MNISETLFVNRPSSILTEKEIICYDLLEKLHIPFSGLTHDHADTIELCEEIEQKLGCKICKNLFLCNAQKTAFYLLLMPGNKPFKTKFLSKQINSARLSFGDAENMQSLLNVTPGSVSVLGLIFDKQKQIHLIIDKDLLKEEYLGCHPCLNTSTLKIKTTDIIDVLLKSLNVTPTYVDLPTQEAEPSNIAQS